LKSGTPRTWEWNIHALNRMEENSPGSIAIRNGGQSLCVDMLAAPPGAFAQTSDWTEPPSKGEAQWHGRFSTKEALASAEFIAVMRIGCKDVAAQATRAAGNWKISVGKNVVTVGGSEAVVQ